MILKRLTLWSVLVFAAFTLSACGDSGSKAPNEIAATEDELIALTDSKLSPALAAPKAAPIPQTAPVDAKTETLIPDACQTYFDKVALCVAKTKNAALANQLQKQQTALLSSPLARATNTKPFSDACRQAQDSFLRNAVTLGCS
jgi:hypothetical protein